jgi:WD40 repeat protein
VSEHRDGRIVTFYSYKGGTGRSMALANVAWILATNGKRVLTIDWDLEAPGLHRYFHPFLADKELTQTEGLIDFFIDFAVAAATPSAESSREKDWYRANANILGYAVSLEHEFPTGGFIDFVSAGKQGAAYSTRVNSFNWDGFYERLGGGVFIEAFKEQARREYDYILIDSRTGVSDTSGICTVQLPDVLVVCFTLNTQGIEGSAAVAKSAFDGSKTRADLKSRQQQLRILPVPMRIENAEYKKLQRQLAHARARFDPFPTQLSSADAEQYWGGVQFPYVPFYAYEEILATVGDRHGDPKQLLAAGERLTGYVTQGEVQELAPIEESERRSLLARFEGEPAPPVSVPVGDVSGIATGRATVSQQTVVAPASRRQRTLLWIGAAVFGALLLVGILLLLALLNTVQSLQSSLAVGTVTGTATEIPPTATVPARATAVAARTAVPTPAVVLAVATSTPTVGRVTDVTPITVATPSATPTITWRQEASFPQQNGGVWNAQFSPDGKTIVTASGDGSVRLWDVNTHQQIGEPLLQTSDGVWSASFSPDGKSVVTAGNDGVALLLDVDSRQQVGAPMAANAGAVYEVAFSPDGSRIATAHDAGILQLWDASSQQPIAQPLSAAAQPIATLASAFDRRGQVWASTFKTARPAGGQVWSVAFSHDGKLLISGHDDGIARLWDVSTGALIGTLTGHSAKVLNVAFSPDDRLVVTSSADGTARLWNTTSQKPVDPPLGPGSERRAAAEVWTASFSADGKTVVTGSADGAVRLWDVSSHAMLVEFAGLSGQVHGAALNPDMTRIVGSLDDGTVLLWTSKPTAIATTATVIPAAAVTDTPAATATVTPTASSPTDTPSPTPTATSTPSPTR